MICVIRAEIRDRPPVSSFSNFNRRDALVERGCGTRVFVPDSLRARFTAVRRATNTYVVERQGERERRSVEGEARRKKPAANEFQWAR